jgi:hypothetical protein
MINDPIVEEVRRYAEQLAKEVDYDPKRYIERLRENQRKSGRKVVSFSKGKVLVKR